jgi:hypothetical protein
MIWNRAYAAPYSAPTPVLPEEVLDIEEPMEPPVAPMKDLGFSVTEGGRFGHFIQGATGAIRKGAGRLELQTQMGGGAEPVGAGAYGEEARQALREMQEATGTKFASVHTPTQIGNMSGFNPQQGFSDEQRKLAVDEVKKAIDFAGDVTRGGPVVVHTGEYQRPISDQDWARDKDGNYKFISYQEEPGRAVYYMVDDRTGRVISDVRKSQVIREPIYLEADHDHEGVDVDGSPVVIHKGDWITEEGQRIDSGNPDHLFKRVPEWDKDKTRFKTRKLGWKEIEERTKWYNKQHPDQERRPEEMAFRIQMETQSLQYRGSSLYHSRFYNDEVKRRDAIRDSLEYYKKLEKEIPEEDAWKILKEDPTVSRAVGGIIPSTFRKPSEILQDALQQAEHGIQYTHEASASADAQAEAIEDTLQHVKPVSDYAVEQSIKSYAEAGIHAMQQSDKNTYVEKPIFVAAENIFPEMGYGSHPEEMIELIEKSREQMVEMLTKPKIPDPYMRRNKDGQLVEKDNPWYTPGMSKEQAKREAEQHIKAMLDTQHLGMWRQHFVSKSGETKQQTDARFKDWYLKQVEELAEKKIIGHVHLVDSIGSGHEHLPPGQGNLPLKEAVKKLKERGFKGEIISEGFGEDRFEEGRQITETWKWAGSPVYSTMVGRFGPQSWAAMKDHWYGQTVPPTYIFGAYSPSNEWVLWSEVPME